MDRRSHRLLWSLVLALAWTMPASACLFEYEFAKNDSPIILAASLSSGNQLKSLTIRDSSEVLFVQQELLDQLQQQQQLMELLSQVIRQQHDMNLSIVRAIGGASAAPADLAAATTTPDIGYALLLSSTYPGFGEISLPLSCLGACDSTLQSDWEFVRFVPEPGTLVLLWIGLACLGLGRGRHRSAEQGRGRAVSQRATR